MSHTRRIVLLGKTGSGKSSLANTILGENVFSVGDSPNSETTACSAFSKTVNGRKLYLIDCPGIFDNNPVTTSHSQAILQCLELCDPGPHSFLLVLKVERYTQQEQDVVNIILQYLSEEALQYTTVVFTHGEDLRGSRIEDWVGKNPSLSALVQKCGGRCHVFDNTHWNNQKQVEELLNTIDRAVEQNGGTCYTIGYLQTVKNYWWRFREAPAGVQLAVFLGVAAVGVLIASTIPWTKVMEMVTAAAEVMRRGAVWLWNQVPTINEDLKLAIEFLANLYNFYLRIQKINEATGSYCSII